MATRHRPAPGYGTTDVFADATDAVRADPRIFGVVFVGNLLGVVPLLGTIFSTIASGVAVTMASITIRGENRSTTRPSTRIVYLLGAFLVATVVVAVGFVLLVIPGIYLLARFVLFPAAVMVDGKGPLQGLSESWQRTGGHVLTVLGFLGVLFGVLFVLGIGGLFVLSPAPAEAVDTLAFRVAAAVLGTPFAALNAGGVAAMYHEFGGDPGRVDDRRATPDRR